MPFLKDGYPCSTQNINRLLQGNLLYTVGIATDNGSLASDQIMKYGEGWLFSNLYTTADPSQLKMDQREWITT